MGETTPDLTGTNPFQLLAYILFKVRHSLEDQEGDRAPRWIRISRARVAQGESDYIGRGVKVAINGFAEALSYMAELTLDLKEVLLQTDAAKALAEVSLDLIRAATDDNFVNGVRALVGEPPGDNPLSVVGTTLDDINRYLGYIPEPEDLEGLGHELYRLLSVEQLALPRDNDLEVDENAIGPDTSSHLDIASSGKIRWLEWAFAEGLTTHGLGTRESPESESYELFRFGSRRLWQTGNDNLPESSIGVHRNGDDSETVFEFFYDEHEQTADNRTLDLVEAHDLLEKLGYTTPAVTDKRVFGAALTARLQRFQAVNELPITGALDNETINRLMNFDFRAKNLARAKPFDANSIPDDIDDDIGIRSDDFKLVNPGADDPRAEGLDIQNDRPTRRYYIAGAPLPATGPASLQSGGGWIRDINSSVIQGFVALETRPLQGDGYEGGPLSEGEADRGKFFFAARHRALDRRAGWHAARAKRTGGQVSTRCPIWCAAVRTPRLRRYLPHVPVGVTRPSQTKKTHRLQPLPHRDGETTFVIPGVCC